MPIDFTCKCGQGYSVPEALAGRELRCPACQEMVVVPAESGPAPVPDDDEPVSDFDDVEEPTHYGFADGPQPAAAAAVDDEPEVVDEEPEVVEEDAPADDASTEDYFVAAYAPTSSLKQPKVFRFYRHRDELLVLHAGPFDWNAVGILANRPGLPEKKKDDGLGRGMETEHDEFVRKGLARRAAVLDRMTLDELRAETESDALSFRITPETTTAARLDPPASNADDRRATENTVARLRFTHSKAGKWDLVLVTKTDVRRAIGALRRVLGVENVEVMVRVK